MNKTLNISAFTLLTTVMSSAAMIITDFNTSAGTAGATGIASVSSSVTGDGLTLNSFSVTDIRNNGGTGGNYRTAPAGTALLNALTFNAQFNTTVGNAGGTLNLSYAVSQNMTIDRLDMRTGFFNGGTGALQSANSGASYTITFTNATGTVLKTWNTTTSTLSGQWLNTTSIGADNAFTVAAGETLNVSIAMTNTVRTGGFMGIDNLTFNVTPTPEPATASLSLLGLAALMMRRRRA